MKLQSKTKKILFAVAIVVFVVMFVITILCTYEVYCVKNSNCDDKCTCVCNNQSNKKSGRTMKSIEKCLEVLVPAKDTKGKCEWLALKDSAQAGIMENYYVEETKEIPAEKLHKILDQHFYIEAGDVVNTGIYMPIARVSYVAANGKNVVLVYSFANSQVNLYRNNEMVKKAMLYNQNELSELLESI